MEKKLSECQKRAINLLKKYPNDMVMFNGWLTGGHGAHIKLNTVRSLQRMGLVERGKLTENGKNIII